MFETIILFKYIKYKSTFVTDISATTVYSLNVEHPIKWCNILPLQENLEVPSGITPFPWGTRIFWQRLVLGDLQNLHSPHCGIYRGSTVSPEKYVI